MTPLDGVPEPSDAELWTIEAEADLLLAELTLVDAEVALFAGPSNATSAAYLQALLDGVDLHNFVGGHSADSCVEATQTRRDSRRPGVTTAGAVS